jgi:hypothetical protein
VEEAGDGAGWSPGSGSHRERRAASGEVSKGKESLVSTPRLAGEVEEGCPCPCPVPVLMLLTNALRNSAIHAATMLTK